jgi:uncharacterized protein YecT (DUF1311 family)
MNVGEIDLYAAPDPLVAVGVLRRRMFVGAAALLVAGSAQAIDNPDAPDRKAEFLARAQPYEERLAAESGGPAWASASTAYATFLDGELNRSYQQLLGHLGDEARRALARSQREWLRFLDAETRFIDRNWTPRNFGSSSVLSRADYRSALVKQRVLTLLAYLQNYS